MTQVEPYFDGRHPSPSSATQTFPHYIDEEVGAPLDITQSGQDHDHDHYSQVQNYTIDYYGQVHSYFYMSKLLYHLQFHC